MDCFVFFVTATHGFGSCEKLCGPLTTPMLQTCSHPNWRRPEGPKAAPHLLRLRVDAAVLEETNDANDPSKARAIMRIYMDFNRR